MALKPIGNIHQGQSGKPRAIGNIKTGKTFRQPAKIKRVAPKIDQKIIDEGNKAKSFLNKSTLGQIFSTQTLKEALKAAVNVAVANPVKFGLSVAEIPSIVKNKKFTNKQYNVPVLGKTTSFQTDYGKVADEVIKGNKGLGSAAVSLAQIPLAGMETGGIAGTFKNVAKGFKGASLPTPTIPNQPLQVVRKSQKTAPSQGKPAQSLPNQAQVSRQPMLPENLPQSRQVSPVGGREKLALETKQNGVNPSYNTSNTGGTKSRGFVDTVKESQMSDPQLVKAVSGTYTPRETEALAKKVNEIISNDITKARDIAYAGSNDESVAMSMELIKHYQNKGDFDSAIQITEDVAQKLTESGRAIQAASLYNRLTPEGILRYAQKQINTFNKANPNKQIKLTSDQAKRLTDLSKEAGSLNGEAQSIATQKLLDEVSTLIPSSKWGQLMTIWKAGLLTNPSTQVANLTGNSSMLALENIKDIPATGFDLLASLLTGKRTKALPNITAQAQGAGEGIRKAGRFMLDGVDPENVLAKVDYQKVNLPPVLKQYTDIVFVLLVLAIKCFVKLFLRSLLLN